MKRPTPWMWLAVVAAQMGLLGASPAFGASCNLSIPNLSFGAYVGIQSQTSSPVSFTCMNVNPALLPEKVDYVISLSAGGGTFAQRRMMRTTLPVDTLSYNLYRGAVPGVLNTNVWGDGSGGTSRWEGRMNLSPGQPTQSDSTTLFGVVPAGIVPAAGTYQDTVVATVLIL